MLWIICYVCFVYGFKEVQTTSYVHFVDNYTNGAKSCGP